MSAWVLPDHIADALPSEARHLEGLRRSLIDTARSYGYELVMPPLLEHLESLLTGVGKSLELQTFKLVDQLSGRMLGLRADTTQQVARIDAHLLNREGLTRLCYCGPVVHARPDNPRATREPLQFGAEIYGYAEIQADVETLLLALDCLQAAGVEHLHIDLGDARIVRAILKNSNADPLTINLIQVALAAKDSAALQLATQKLPSECIAGLHELLDLYGDESVLDRAAVILKDFPEIEQALAELKMLSSQISGASVSFDLSDLSGYSYYSGLRFSIYTRSAGIPIARGGRYDEVGAVFGRNRPAVGFSLDLRTLVRIVQTPPLQRAIGARWLLPEEGTSACSMASFRAAVKMLRNAGETVVCMPDLNIMYESEEFFYDRVLVLHDGHWILENFNANQSRKFGNE